MAATYSWALHWSSLFRSLKVSYYKENKIKTNKGRKVRDMEGKTNILIPFRFSCKRQGTVRDGQSCLLVVAITNSLLICLLSSCTSVPSTTPSCHDVWDTLPFFLPTGDHWNAMFSLHTQKMADPLHFFLFCTTLFLQHPLIIHCVRGASQPPSRCVPGIILRGSSGRDVKLTTHRHLEQRLKIHGAVPALPHMCTCLGALYQGQLYLYFKNKFLPPSRSHSETVKTLVC